LGIDLFVMPIFAMAITALLHLDLNTAG